MPLPPPAVFEPEPATRGTATGSTTDPPRSLYEHPEPRRGTGPFRVLQDVETLRSAGERLGVAH